MASYGRFRIDLEIARTEDDSTVAGGVPAAAVAKIVASAGLGESFRLQRLSGGTNNRVYKVVTQRRAALLKVYFRNPGDPRDRLATEYALLEFAAMRDIHQVPKPLGRDEKAGLGLYEFLEGRVPVPADITLERIMECVAFFHALNAHRSDPAAKALGPASEGCLTVKEHLRLVGDQLDRLEHLDPDLPYGSDCARWVSGSLLPEWEKIKVRSGRLAERFGITISEGTSVADLRISPADFGFFNAILGDQLRFIDFEYAGWDDPARMVCDFFCHPEMSVPREYMPVFAAEIGANLVDLAGFHKRVRLLWPIRQIRWICIVLNHFLATAGARRRFAQGAIAPALLASQLDKAKGMLLAINDRELNQHSKSPGSRTDPLWAFGLEATGEEFSSI